MSSGAPSDRLGEAQRAGVPVSQQQIFDDPNVPDVTEWLIDDDEESEQD